MFYILDCRRTHFAWLLASRSVKLPREWQQVGWAWHSTCAHQQLWHSWQSTRERRRFAWSRLDVMLNKSRAASRVLTFRVPDGDLMNTIAAVQAYVSNGHAYGLQHQLLRYYLVQIWHLTLFKLLLLSREWKRASNASSCQSTYRHQS